MVEDCGIRDRSSDQLDAISPDDGKFQEPPNMIDHLSTLTLMEVHTMRENIGADQAEGRSSEKVDSGKTIVTM